MRPQPCRKRPLPAGADRCGEAGALGAAAGAGPARSACAGDAAGAVAGGAARLVVACLTGTDGGLGVGCRSACRRIGGVLALPAGRLVTAGEPPGAQALAILLRRACSGARAVPAPLARRAGGADSFGDAGIAGAATVGGTGGAGVGSGGKAPAGGKAGVGAVAGAGEGAAGAGLASDGCTTSETSIVAGTAVIGARATSSSAVTSAACNSIAPRADNATPRGPARRDPANFARGGSGGSCIDKTIAHVDLIAHTVHYNISLRYIITSCWPARRPDHVTG